MLLKFLTYFATFLFGLGSGYLLLVNEVFGDEFTPSNFLSTEGVSWTDVLSSVSTLLTFIVVTVTYTKWKEIKVKEDAYDLTKDYLRCLGDIAEKLDASYYYFDSCVPQAGMFVLNKTQSDDLLMKGYDAHSLLRLDIYRLENIKKELRFWGVSLKGRLKADHLDIIKNAEDFLLVHNILGRQIQNFYKGDELQEEGIKRMSRELKRLGELSVSLQEVFGERLKSNYNDCFDFTTSKL
ncbi:hypothetical protein [Marinomonas sp. FW-1]|uniref:hypothetical protein n=1 Tax=Marinomonas sp. FW-1 TaxID=2071621 RepID=UPI0010C135ED|nr:hypothetical protein [Marinomonas sp. FW-1]